MRLIARRQLDLAEHDIHHAVEDLVLVGDMVVERHRLDVQAVREPAHGERADAVLVGEGHRFEEHPLPAQRGASLRAHIDGWCHEDRPHSLIDSLTLYGYLMT
jgi:hypothetical protein